MAPEVIAAEVVTALTLVGGHSVDGEHIDIDSLEELEVGALEDGGRGIFDLGEGVGIGGVGLGSDDLIGLWQPLAPVGNELLVVGSRHADVHVVVPGYEALVAHGSEHGACPEVIAQMMLAAEAVDGLEVADDLLLEDADVVVGFVMQSHSSSLNSISRFF